MIDRQLAALPCGVLLLLGACGIEDRDLTLAVSTEEPAPTIAQTVRQTLLERDFLVDIETVIDPAETIDRIVDRRLDLAIIEEPDHPLPGIITLAPLYPSVLHVMHNRAVTPGSFAEMIRDANVYAGPEGGTAYRLLLALAGDSAVGPDEFQLLENPWTVNPDVYFIFGGLLAADSVAKLAGYRLFSFGSENDEPGGSIADGIVLRHHHLRPFLLPKGVYHSLADDAVLTLSIRSVLVAHEDFDTEFAFEISAALFTNAQEIASQYPLVTRELNENLQTVELMLPLHDGTRRYLDRDRPGFIERYVEVLALYFTVILALLSGGFALYRYRLQVRKDRVDVYYARLLDIRKQMETSTAEAELASCQRLVLDVQHEVLDLLIDERIAADNSLIAFVSLSNQMINELDRRI